MFKKLLSKLKFARKDEKREFLKKIFNFVKQNKVEGAYCEFGVYKGGTFIEAWKIAQAKGLKMDFWAFDSFEGLPSDEGTFKKGGWSFGMKEFVGNLLKAGVPVEFDTVKVIRGFFKESLKGFSGFPIAIAYIDSDLYESAVEVLEFLTPRIQDGTVLVFDDFYFHKGNPERGEQGALKEWLEKNPDIKVSEYQKYFWNGNSFIIHKNEQK